VEIYEAADIY